MSKIYQAQSKLLLEKEIDSEKAMLFRMNVSQGYANFDFINSEIEILNSYPIAAKVVKTFYSDLTREDDIKLNEEDEVKRFEKTVKEFQEKIEIENPKNSTILIISYENKDARLTADIVNNFVNTYITYRSEISAESGTYQFFEEQMNLADQKLRGLEQRQAQFKQQKELGSPDAQRSIPMTRITDYEQSLTAVQTKRIGKQAKLAVIKEQVNKGASISIPSTEASDSPSREKYIAKMKGDLLDMEIRKEQLLQKFTPQYKEIVNLEKEIAATKSMIEKEIRQIVHLEETSVRALRAEERVLKQQIERIKNDIRDLAQKESEYNPISRGIDDEREIYSMLLKQREEARLSLARLKMGIKIKVISPAVTPTEPVKPKKRLNVLLAIFLGIFGGMGLAFFIDYFDHTISTPDELERHTGISALGSVREIKMPEFESKMNGQAERILDQ